MTTLLTRRSLGRDADLVQGQLTVGVVTTQQGVGDGLRLLVDLLAHEPVEAVLLGRGDVPVDVVRLEAGRRGAVEVGDLDLVAGHLDDLVVAELDGLTGELEEGGDIGAEEVLALADADDQRAGAAGGDDAVGILGVDGDQGEGALQAGGDGAHGVDDGRALVDELAEQLGGGLGVGLALELDAGGLELGAQLGEVLDDAVVHQRDTAGLADVRVRVLVGRAAMGGPTGVTDALVALGDRIGLELGIQVGDLAGLLGPVDLALGLDGEAGRVIATVLKAAKAFDDDGLGATRPDVTHNSTHGKNRTVQLSDFPIWCAPDASPPGPGGHHGPCM